MECVQNEHTLCSRVLGSAVFFRPPWKTVPQRHRHCKVMRSLGFSGFKCHEMAQSMDKTPVLQSNWPLSGLFGIIHPRSGCRVSQLVEFEITGEKVYLHAFGIGEMAEKRGNVRVGAACLITRMGRHSSAKENVQVSRKLIRITTMPGTLARHSTRELSQTDPFFHPSFHPDQKTPFPFMLVPHSFPHECK